METNINNTSDKVRYSDEELAEFKELILERLARARKDLEMLNENVSGNGNNADDTAPTFKILEEGSNVLSKEENSQLAARQYKYIQNLENALIRIENKTYGVCRMTGKLIPKERLRAVPHATLSVEAKMGQKK
ncbi:MAG: TraR/DksA family transcriptional regulator [Bacteroidales bacterium]|jgi:RNA polymerase-binding transcription factor DksA|nr:TraR/DksA family transcriptional regulator [Bacteroidales bacterium]MBO5847886.1 TraR/DksA family transcriptional regulator [Bacteroidales bacterium]MBO5854777.1 TraR/DksA family transcriptional regulator [Bacteroidales bacterium]